jgi:regulator of sigma E protease
MDFLSGVVGFVVGIGILVFVHELGHFLMAKWCGVRVEKFSIGFPPKIISFTKGDTEYVIGATPLGGYVKMAGMIDENMDSDITGASDEFNSKNAWQKSLILLGGVLFNVLFAIVVLFSLNMTEGKTKILNTEIQTIHPKSQLKRFIPEPNVLIEAIDNEPVIYYNDITEKMIQRIGDSYPIDYKTADGESHRIEMPDNFPLDKKLFSLLDFRYNFLSTIYVDSVIKNSVAEEIGLIKSDTLVSINGQKITSFSRLEELKELAVNLESTLVIQRGQELDTLAIHLTRGADNLVMLGFSPGIKFKSPDWINSKIVKIDYSFSEAIYASVVESAQSIMLNFKSIRSLLRGDQEVRESVGGPIAIADILGQSIGDFGMFFRIVAMISIMLAFMNVLPIPGLDGGHLMIVIIEGVRGKPLEIETKMKVQKAGIIFLFTLMVFVLTNDVSRYF